MRSRRSRSSEAKLSASWIIRLTSRSLRVEEPCTVILCSRPVVLSLAVTCRIPLASISKATCTWGIPLGAGGIPDNLNRPRDLLSLAISRSPWRTWISTTVWLFSLVEKMSDLRTGMVVLRGKSFFMTPPMVSSPKDKGVTSNNKISLT